MKTIAKCAALVAAISLACISVAVAQGTAFTYQGRLNSGTIPANGSYDLTFALYDAVSGGTQQGNTVTNSALAVSNGLFTVLLDFGSQFPGANRWLEIGVCTNGSGTFTTVSPRQQVTSAPYSITAGTVTGPINGASILAGTVTGTQLAAGAVGYRKPCEQFDHSGAACARRDAGEPESERVRGRARRSGGDGCAGESDVQHR